MDQSGKMTSGDRLTGRLLHLAPWLAFFLIALPPPLYFLFRYFTSIDEPGVWMLFTLVSLPVAALVALAVVVMLFFYRRHWEKRLRDRLAADGITADEVQWFHPELTRDERRSLKQMQQQNPLLADAYGETLAARLTATRVIASTQREKVLVERRMQQIRTLHGAGRAALENDLRDDHARLASITREAIEHKAEAETRLRMIEATASRGANEADTARALQRLGQMRQYLPLALESARLEREARTHVAQDSPARELPATQPDTPPVDADPASRNQGQTHQN